MELDYHNCSSIVGGQGNPTNKNPFDTARVVIKVSDNTYFIVHCYSAEGKAGGNFVNDDEMAGLVEEGSIFLLKEPIVIPEEAIFIMFGSKFKLLLPEASPPNNPLDPSSIFFGPLALASPASATQIFLMSGLSAKRTRVYYSSIIIEKAFELAHNGKWKEGLEYAKLYFVISLNFFPSTLAVLLVFLEEAGEKDLFKSYIAMARRSEGNEFVGDAINDMEEIREGIKYQSD